MRSGKTNFSNLRIRILSIIMGALIFQVSFLFSPLKALLGKAEGMNTNKWDIQYPELNANWLNDIWAESDNNVFVAGFGINGATIGHYDGQSWKTTGSYIMEEPTAELTGIWGSSGSDIFAVGSSTWQSGGRIIILHYNGTQWAVMPSDLPGYLLDVWGSGPNDVFAAGGDGLILHWNGSSWTQMNIDSACNPAHSLPDIQSIWGDGPNNVFCLGLCSDINTQDVVSTIYHYQNGTWFREQEIPSVWLYDIWGTPGSGSMSGGDIWAVGDHIFRRQGGAWQNVTPANIPDFYLNKIVGRSGTDLMAVGTSGYYAEEGIIIRYDGQSWTKVTEGSVSGYLRSAWLGPNGRAMVVGGNYAYEYPSRGIVLYYNGVSWADLSAQGYEGTCFQVWVNSGQDAFVVGGHPDPMTDELARVFIAHYDGEKWSPS